MFCRKCGTEMPSGTRFCKECGTPTNVAAVENDSEQTIYTPTSRKDRFFAWFNKQSKRAVVIESVAAALLVVLVFGLFTGRSSKPAEAPVYKVEETTSEVSATGSTTNSKTNSEKETVPTSSVAEEPAVVSVPSTFAITNIQGERLEVEQGYTYVSNVKTLSNNSGRTASVLIPPIFDYTGVEYSMGTESVNNGVYGMSFSAERSDMDFITNYIADLTKYGFTLEKTWTVDTVGTDQIIYFLNCSGNVTHGLVTFLSTSYDMEITAYRDALGTSFFFKYPPEVGFDLSGGGEEYTSVKVATNYSFDNGSDRFEIRGWGKDNSDYIILLLQQDAYQTGDVIRKSDLKAQSGAGDSALYRLTILGDCVCDGSAGIDDLDEAEIKILENSASCLAFSYYIEVTKGSEHYTLEGVSAAELAGGGYGGGYEATEGNNDSFENGIAPDGICVICHGGKFLMCTSCSGAGKTKCHQCGGDGLAQCSQCHGTGLVTASHGGTTKTCSACNGHGTKKCNYCTNGLVQCTNCSGKGQKTCYGCNGTGKN